MNTFYSDENLMNAGPKVKYPVKTIAQIQEYFPELPVLDLWHNPKMGFLKIATFDQAETMFNEGRISSEYWDAFQAVYRNLTPRFSSLAIRFEMK
jgi:hypothetical protein